MIGTKFYKSGYDRKEYASAASWCNKNHATIKDMGDWYEVVELPAPTEEQIQAQLTAAVQRHMDNTARTRNYDNIHTACSYANSTDALFAAEGLACVKWRDDVWRTCYNILAEVKAGTRAVPTADELITELPALEW